MNLLDLILAGIVAGSVASGMLSGLARAGIGFLTTILAVLLGFWFYGVPAVWIESLLGVPTAVAGMGGFLAVFLTVSFAGAGVAMMIAKLFQWTGMAWIDKALGAGFGLVRGGLMAVAFVAALMAFTPRPTPNWMVGSQLLPYAVDASNQVAAMAPLGLKNMVMDGLAGIKDAWQEELEKARQRGIDTMNGTSGN